MFWAIFVVLLVLWAIGLICHVAFSNLLLVIAVIVLLTPAGHPEAGWVTFSSYVEEGCTFAQVQVLARAGDPLYELAFRLVGSQMQDEIWTHVLTALAAHLGTSGDVQMDKALLDHKLQWGRAWNIWYSAQLRTLLYSPITLLRWVSARFRPKSRRGAT